MRDQAIPPDWFTRCAFAGLWLLLLAVHYVLLLIFAGWFGAADGFVPWTIAAFGLWEWTRRRMGWQPLHAHRGGRILLASVVVLLLLAMAGVDEGGVPWLPAVPAAVTYMVLPLLVVLAIWVLLARSAFQKGNVPTAI